MTSIWHANSRLCKLRREMRLAKRPAEMACVGMHPPSSRLQRGGRCAQQHGLFCGPGIAPGGPGQDRLGSGQVKLLCWVAVVAGHVGSEALLGAEEAAKG